MQISISSRLFEALATASEIGLPEFEFTHEAALQALPRGVDPTLTTLSATQIVGTLPGGYTMTLSGAGISPISSLEDLGEAIDQGIATGTLSSLVIAQNGTALVSLTLAPTGVTLASDPAEVELVGLVPTSLEQLLDIAEVVNTAGSTIEDLAAVVQAYDLDALSFRVNDETLISLIAGLDSLTLELPAHDLRIVLPGTYPGNLGELVTAIQAAGDDAGETGDPLGLLFAEYFNVTGAQLTDMEGTLLASVTEGDGSQFQDDHYFLIEQNLWWPRDWLGFWTPALLAGEVVFPAGTPGADLIELEDIPGYVIAGAGDDVVVGSSGDDELNGNEGNDSLNGAGGNDAVYGGSGDDTLEGGSGSDSLYGGSGELGGNDVIRGGSSADLIYGMVGNDTLHGDSSADTIFGGQMSDRIWGDDGDDLLYGESSADTVYGGDGNDTIEGGSSSDTLEGGEDDDVVYGGSSADLIRGDDGADTLEGGTADDTIFGGANGDRIDGGDGNDSLAGDGSSDTIFGGIGDDVIDGGSSADTLHGDDGADSILGGSSADVIFGGLGQDTIRGGTSNDTIDGGSSSDRLWGDSGDDSLSGGNSADTVYGGDGNDVIDGGSSADRLFGGSNSDTIIGGSGNDTLFGGGSSDTLTGGTGADVFVFNTGIGASVDTITDFSVADDTIQLDNDIFTGLAAGALEAAAFGLGAATTAAQRVLYDAGTGALSFDADGNGAGAAVRFATLGTGLALTEADFFVI